jgi:hypothetical protein
MKSFAVYNLFSSWENHMLMLLIDETGNDMKPTRKRQAGQLAIAEGFTNDAVLLSLSADGCWHFVMELE